MFRSGKTKIYGGGEDTMPVVPGLLFGMQLSNNAGDAVNDIDFSAGFAVDSTNVSNMIGNALTKQLDAAWAAGNNAGGRLSAAAIANTTYHCFAILKDSDQTVDYGFDVSATAPTMPAGYTKFRRIGSIVRSGGSIRAFTQRGDDFSWVTPVASWSANNPGVAAVTQAVDVPLGIVVQAKLAVRTQDNDSPSTGLTCYLSELAQTDSAPTGTFFSYVTSSTTEAASQRASAPVPVYTNTSAQIRFRVDKSNANTFVVGTCLGYTDQRGRTF